MFAAISEASGDNQASAAAGTGSGTAVPGGLKAMIVEDNALLAMLLEDMLGDLGITVSGAATNLADAVTLAGHVQADVAVLDLNLDGELSFPAAERLSARGIPVIFATGYGTEQMPDRFASAPTIEKPFAPQELEAALLRAMTAR